MSAHQAQFRIATMARVLGVSTSGYYAWRRRPPSARAQADADLTARVEEIHTRSCGTYGAPRIHAELAEAGVAVSRKRVARVMRAADIAGVSRRRGPLTTRRDVQTRPAPDRVKRQFEADAPNRLWVADITYVPTLVGFLYLAIVLDVFSRRVVGWAMAAHLRTELVIEALEMAVAQRRPDAVVHHSDQGCQYTSLAFGARCRKWGVALSMGSVGDCFDNAMAESFFATLECELLDRTTLSTHAEARAAILISSKVGTTRDGAIPRWATCRRWSSNVSMRLSLWTLTGRWRLSRLPRFSWSPDRRRRLASSPAFFWKHTEGMMTCRPTARLRLRKTRSCCETCRLDVKTTAGLLGRRASLDPGGCGRRHRMLEPCTVSPRGAVDVALNLEVGEAGTPSPLEISRAIIADHAFAGAARFPHSHSASSSMTDTETTFIKDVS